MAKKNDYQKKRIGTRLHYRRQITDPAQKTKSGAPKKWSSPWLPTKEEVNDWVRDKRAELAAKAPAGDTDISVLSLSLTVDKWIECRSEGDDAIGESTAYSYLQLKRYLPEELAQKPLKDITKADLKAWVANLKETKSSDTARRQLMHMKMCLQWAVDEEHLDDNPAAGIKKPARSRLSHEAAVERAERTGADFYDQEDPVAVSWFLTTIMVETLLRTVDGLYRRGYVGEHPGGRKATPRRRAWRRWRPFIYLLFLSGLRIGEALALRWKDIDFEKCLIRVRFTIARTKQGPKLRKPKTKAGIRDVPLPSEMMKILKAWRRRRAGDGFVFGTGRGDRFELWNNVYRRCWQPLFEEAARLRPDLPFLEDGAAIATVHDARHHHASVLFDSGIDTKLIARRLGHASEEITRKIYIHLLNKRTAEEVEMVDGIFDAIRRGGAQG